METRVTTAAPSLKASSQNFLPTDVFLRTASVRVALQTIITQGIVGKGSVSQKTFFGQKIFCNGVGESFLDT
jgi:hypothetical protein